jgi:hypothetical protein
MNLIEKELHKPSPWIANIHIIFSPLGLRSHPTVISVRAMVMTQYSAPGK